MTEIQKKDDNLTKQEDKKLKTEEIRDRFKNMWLNDEQDIKEYVALVEKDKLTDKEDEKLGDLSLKIAMTYGLQNGLWTGNLSYQKYLRPLATIRNSVVKEYDCKSSLELMIADRIVGNYWRSMRCDMTLNRLIEKDDSSYSFNDSKMRVIQVLSKELEAANRQLHANIILLKELKQPKLNIKVNTDAAFFGQNQQFNVNKEYEQEK